MPRSGLEDVPLEASSATSGSLDGLMSERHYECS